MVYVDNAYIEKRGRQWCHLLSDKLWKLHEFARIIGVPPQAFHSGARHPHYDITIIQRQRALANGAKPITVRDAVRLIRSIPPEHQNKPQLELFS